jgi:hypothetical protein
MVESRPPATSAATIAPPPPPMIHTLPIVSSGQPESTSSGVTSGYATAIPARYTGRTTKRPPHGARLVEEAGQGPHRHLVSR